MSESLLNEETDRVRALIGMDPRISEKRAFGGIMFLLNGHMLVSIKKDGQMLFSVGRQANQAALARPGASQMLHGGKPMRGFIWVTSEALAEEADLAGWLAFASTEIARLPPGNG